MSLDISLELPEHHGAECVSYIKEKLKEFEVLSPITFALKTSHMRRIWRFKPCVKTIEKVSFESFLTLQGRVVVFNSLR